MRSRFRSLSGKELQRAWQDDPKRYRERALCAVRETRAVADLLSPSYFIQAQIFPYNYQDVIVRGNATRINALFLREYFRQRHGIPEMPMVRGFEGGYTDIFFTGVARNVWHCDVASLYPSIMLQFDCFPVTDQLQIFRHLLTDLRTFRLRSEERHARREGRGAAALLPRAAKHLQDSDQQLLRLSRFRAGKFRRFRSRRASHADRARFAQEDDRMAARRRARRSSRSIPTASISSRRRRATLRSRERDLQRQLAWRKNCRPASRSSSTSNSKRCSATRRRTTRSSPTKAKSSSKAARSSRAAWRNSSAFSSRK